MLVVEGIMDLTVLVIAGICVKLSLPQSDLAKASFE
jgi:hypothetical protein